MIVRSKRSESFTIIGNAVLADDRISFRSKGVLVYLLGKPDNWQVSERHLATVGHEGVTAVRAALRELEEAGYIQRRRKQGPNGRFEWESVVFDEPQPLQLAALEPSEPEEPDEPCSENLSTENEPPCLGFPCVGEPCVENRAVINTIGTRTEQTRTKDDDCARDLPAPQPPVLSSSSRTAGTERIRLPAAAVAALTQPHDPAYLAAKTVYENNIGLLTPITSDLIKTALQTYPPEWIPLAIERAVAAEKRQWNYVAGILRNWSNEGFTNGSARTGNAGKASKSKGYGRYMQQATATSAKGPDIDYDNDPDWQEFMAGYVDARDAAQQRLTAAASD